MTGPQFPGILADGGTYWPTGQLRHLRFGNSYTQTQVFNNRLQPCRINYNDGNVTLNTCTDPPPSFNLDDFSYTYNSGTANNGNIASWTASGWLSFNRNYVYDQLNRLSTMADPNSTQPCHGLSWTYDAWGNRTSQTTTGGSCFQQPATTFTARNQFPPTPYQYDSAGNMTFDGTYHYSYDAENRLIQVQLGAPGNCSTAVACYLYDALGRRVHKSGAGVSLITDYVYDLSGRVVAEFAPTCSGAECWTVDYVYFNGTLLTEYKNATTYFVHTDHLGSTHLVTDVTANFITDCFDYLPFGEPTQPTPTTPCSSGSSAPSHSSTSHDFTGKERDPESGLDNFGARYDSSSMGRFMSPDPDNAGARPWAPQSWNAYSYVLNNPLKYVDPSGLDCIYLSEAGTGVDHVLTGGNPDCTNAGGKSDNGYYVDGTVDRSSIALTGGDSNTLFYTFTNDNNPSSLIGRNCVGDCSAPDQTVQVFSGPLDQPQPTSSISPGEFDPFAPARSLFSFFHYNPPTTLAGKAQLAVGCLAGTPSDAVGPINEDGGPQDATDSTGNRRNVSGPGKNGKPRSYNPKGSSAGETAEKAGDTLAYVRNIPECYHNGTTKQ